MPEGEVGGGGGGGVSRVRLCLTGASLAPGTEETFDAMQNRRPQEVVRNIP